jgi:cytidine deaminase
MRLIHKQIELRAFDKLQDMLEEDRALLAAATQAAQQAYAPYSGFQVGAAVLLENGEVVAGSNQENMAYPRALRRTCCCFCRFLGLSGCAHPKNSHHCPQ